MRIKWVGRENVYTSIITQQSIPTSLLTITTIVLGTLGIDSDRIGVVGVSSISTIQEAYTHSSVSASCARAFLAIVWKACSTLIASFAEVSKYGMLPLD